MMKELLFFKFYFIFITVGVYSFNIELINNKDACSKTCQNGAKCTKMGKYEFCKCLPGTFGDNCGIVPDCIDEVINCTESSNSVCGYNVQLEEAECICSDSNLAYDSKAETCRETCSSDIDCRNEATCKTIGNYKFCDCPSGTHGHACEKVTDCDNGKVMCREGSGATCGYNTTISEAECLCSDSKRYDYRKNECRDPCSSDTDCENKAKCKPDKSNSFCDCPPGTNGDKCQKVIDCENGKVICKTDSGAACGYNTELNVAECLCDGNERYDTVIKECRETCSSEKDCSHGAKCKSIGNYNFCDCLSGTYGFACDKVIDCDNNKITCKPSSGGICGYNTKLKLAECLCSDIEKKYDLETEECRETCTDGEDCKHEAYCKIIGNYKFCECHPGTYGHKCEKVRDCDDITVTCKEGSGATCGYNTKYKVAECLCPNREKYDLETKVCRETCAFESDCKNEAKCKNIGTYTFCECSVGTGGHKCEKVTDCDNHKVKCKEGSGAFCGYNTRLKVAECLCSDDKIYDTRTKECRGTCNLDSDCRNEAKCKIIGNYALCDCPPGTYGHKCERVTDCENGKLTCKASSGATCGYNTTTKGAECLCSDSRIYDYGKNECRDSCSSDTDCENEAKCKTDKSNSFCDCPPGTYGDKCEIVEDCEKHNLMCKEDSGARCGYNTTLKTAECLCSESKRYDHEAEWCRETCTVDRDCENGARCRAVDTYAFCNCPTGTYGDNCEIVEDCFHNKLICKEDSRATCGYNTTLKAAECLCADYKRYDHQTEECKETCNDLFSCENGGICKRIGNYDFCECISGTYGDFCQYVTSCKDETLLCRNDSGAVCGFNAVKKQPECLCYNGLKYDSYLGLCRVTCKVAQHHCQNGAACKTIGDYNFCDCLNGTYGHYCENVTDCDRNYLTCNKESGAICGYNASLQIAECLCEDDLKYDIITETCEAFTSSMVDEISTAQYTASTFPSNVTTDVTETRPIFSTFTVDSTVFTTDIERTVPEISTTSYVNKCNISSSICPKMSTECVPNGNDYYCKCKAGFRLRTGAVKEHNKISCIKKKCNCGMNSYDCKWSNQDRKICSCFHGYSQIKGVCADCYCGTNSLVCVFHKNGRKLCGCKTGYFQRNETCSEMCTNDRDCQNGGVCELESYGMFCRCKSPFKGDKCEFNEACEQLSNTCNAVGAVCQYIELIQKGACVCPSNRYFNDESNICEEKFESSPSMIIILSIISGFLLLSTGFLVIVLLKFRSSGSQK